MQRIRFNQEARLYPYDSVNTKNSGSGTCFREVAEKWLDTVAARKNRSWKQQKRQLERHVYPAWKNRDITDLRRRDVYLLLDGLDGKVLPNRILALLKTVMNFAVLREWVEKSPADGIPMPRHERPRQRVLTMGELSVVQEACVQLGYPFGSFVQMLMLTAQRRTEVASMRWAEIDFDSMNWVLPAMKTKSYTAHSVPLSSFSAALLKGISVNGEFVFSNDGRTHISGFSSGKRQLDARANSVRGQVEGWRLHDLRRSAATHMVRLGARETIVSRILNHSQNGLTTRVYALHSHAADKRCALQNWGKELKRNLGNIAGHDLAS